MDKILQRLEKGPTLGERVFIAPTASVLGDVRLGNDVSLWHGVVLRGDVDTIYIGNGSNIQDGSVLHVTKDKYPVSIGENTTVGHGVNLHGCRIGNNVLVGIGSIILDGVEVGDNCIIAAGSLIPPGKKIPSGSMVMGHPAKITRSLNEADLEAIKANVRRYIEYKDLYLAHEIK